MTKHIAASTICIATMALAAAALATPADWRPVDQAIGREGAARCSPASLRSQAPGPGSSCASWMSSSLRRGQPPTRRLRCGYIGRQTGRMPSVYDG